MIKSKPNFKKIMSIILSLLIILSTLQIATVALAPEATVVRRLNGQISYAELADALGEGRGTYRYNVYNKDSYVDIEYTFIPNNGDDKINAFEDGVIYKFLYKGSFSSSFSELGYFVFKTYYNIGVSIEGELPKSAEISVNGNILNSAQVYEVDKNDTLILDVPNVDGYIAQVKSGSGMWQTVEEEKYIHTAEKSTDLSVRYITETDAYKINVTVNNGALGEYSGILSDIVKAGEKFTLTVTPYNEITSDYDFDAYVKSVTVNGTELSGTYAGTVFTGAEYVVDGDVNIEIDFAERLVLKEGTIEYKKYEASGNNDIYLLYPAQRNGYLKVSDQIVEIENSIISTVVDTKKTGGYDRSGVTIELKGYITVIGDQYHELSYNVLGQNWGDRTFDNEGDIDEWEEIRIIFDATERYPQVVTGDITVLPVESRKQLSIGGTTDTLKVSSAEGLTNQIRAKVRSQIIANNSALNLTEDDILNSGITYNFTDVDFETLSFDEAQNITVSVNIPDSENFLESAGTVKVSVLRTIESMDFYYNINAVGEGVLHYYDGLYQTTEELSEAIKKVVSYEIVAEGEETPELPQGTMYVEYLARAETDDLKEEWLIAGVKFDAPETLDPENPGYYGCHLFGANSTETVRYRLVDSEGAELISNSVEIEVKDLRADTKIVVNNNITYDYGTYEEMTVEDLKKALVEGVYTVVDGANQTLIDNAELDFSPALDSLEKGANIITVTFAGDTLNYKSSTETVTLTINGKAVESVTVSGGSYRYSENIDYNFSVATVPENLNTINVVAGLRLGGDSIGVSLSLLNDGLADKLVDALRIQKGVAENETFQPTFIDLIMLFSDSTSEFTGITYQLVHQQLYFIYYLMITGSGVQSDLPLFISEEVPTDAGFYFTIATVDEAAYEEKYGIGYLLIAPEHTAVTLEWANELENGLASAEKVAESADYLDAVVADKEISSENAFCGNPISLFIGTDVSGTPITYVASDTVPTKAEGGVEGQGIINPKDIPQGAYTQIAMLLPAGNQTYSSLPIIRNVVIGEQSVQVKIKDSNGEEITSGYYLSGSSSDEFKVEVTDNDGNLIEDEQNVIISYRLLIGLGLGVLDSIGNQGIVIVTATYLIGDGTNVTVAGADSKIVICASNNSFAVEDTEIVYDGNEHFVDTVNYDETLECFGLIVDSANKKMNLMLPESRNQLSEFIKSFGEDIYSVFATSDEAIDTLGESIKQFGIEDIKKITGYTVEVDGELPSDAGTYQVYTAVHQGDYWMDARECITTATLEIKKVPITITIDDATISRGDELPEFAYTVEGEIVDGEVLNVSCYTEYTYLAGTYAIKANVTGDIKNYAITVNYGTFTVKEVYIIKAMTSQIRFDINEDGSYAHTFDVRTRAKIADEDFAKFIATDNETAEKIITKAGFVYSINPEIFSIEDAKIVAQGGEVAGYTDAPVNYIQDADGYYTFTCIVIDIPDTEIAQTLVSFAYICVEIDGVEYWYFMDTQAEADFNSLYTTYLPMACEAYGWESFGDWKENGDGTHSRNCGLCGKIENGDCVYDKYVNNEDGTHNVVCSLCGHISVTEDHTYNENATCTICGDVAFTYDAETNTYIVYNANGLYAWNEKVQEIFANAFYGDDGELEYGEDLPNLTLAADITLTGENNWTPLGGKYDVEGSSTALYYNGVIDGNGHTITGLRINNDSEYQGFIGMLGAGGAVKNLTFADAVISGGEYTGIVVGWSEGTIENCHVTSGLLTTTNNYAGGIVGQNQNGTVINCTNAATITVAQGATNVNNLGGIAGRNSYDGTIMGCINTGTISSGNLNIGGVLGDNDGIVVACSNKGAVTGSSQTGGIIGIHLNSSKACGSWTVTTAESDNSGDGIGSTSGNFVVTGCFAGDTDTINSKVAEMNEAIATYNADDENTVKCPYIWQVGADGYPTLVEATE